MQKAPECDTNCLVKTYKNKRISDPVYWLFILNSALDAKVLIFLNRVLL